MITEVFETDRPIFFLSDKEAFKPLEIDMRSGIHSQSDTTVALSCAIVTDDLENTLSIYIDEEFVPDTSMELAVRGNLSLPSRVMEILDSDAECIFGRDLGVDSILLEVYVNRNHDFMPETFAFVIRTT